MSPKPPRGMELHAVASGGNQHLRRPAEELAADLEILQAERFLTDAKKASAPPRRSPLSVRQGPALSRTDRLYVLTSHSRASHFACTMVQRFPYSFLLML